MFIPSFSYISLTLSVSLTHSLIPSLPLSLSLFLISDTLQKLKEEKVVGDLKDVVVVVCGGLGVNLESLAKWKEIVGLDAST